MRLQKVLISFVLGVSLGLLYYSYAYADTPGKNCVKAHSTSAPGVPSGESCTGTFPCDKGACVGSQWTTAVPGKCEGSGSNKICKADGQTNVTIYKYNFKCSGVCGDCEAVQGSSDESEDVTDCYYAGE